MSDPTAALPADATPAERQALDALVRAVAEGQGYRGLARELIAAVALRELRKPGAQRPSKELVKTTRARLHQVTGAYLPQTPYARWRATLTQAAQSGERQPLHAAARDIMRAHASTRERLPILEQFYATTLGDLPPLQRILDLACGLHPLALPWMPLAPNATYHAYDVYPHLAQFLTDALATLGAQGVGHVADLTATLPTEDADVALLLKAIPCLDQLSPTASARLLDALAAPYLLVSFPAASLGGKRKGMVATYEARMERLLSGKNWTVHRYDFASELVFRIHKS